MADSGRRPTWSFRLVIDDETEEVFWSLFRRVVFGGKYHVETMKKIAHFDDGEFEVAIEDAVDVLEVVWIPPADLDPEQVRAADYKRVGFVRANSFSSRVVVEGAFDNPGVCDEIKTTITTTFRARDIGPLNRNALGAQSLPSTTTKKTRGMGAKTIGGLKRLLKVRRDAIECGRPIPEFIPACGQADITEDTARANVPRDLHENWTIKSFPTPPDEDVSNWR